MQIIGVPRFIILTSFYGPKRIDDKLGSIHALKDIRERKHNPPWIIGVYFNMITSLAEGKGGQRRIQTVSKTIKRFIEEAHLIDMEIGNEIFTWSNNWRWKHQVASKLNRFLICKDILLQRLGKEENILPTQGSNHYHVVLVIAMLGTPKDRSFIFEAFWIIHP